MGQTLAEKKELAVWIARCLFARGRTSGTTANLSFLHEDSLYITCSGSCFGTLTEDQLVEIRPGGTCMDSAGRDPSKELALHQALYRRHPEVTAVLHTHSPNAVLWSCIRHDDARNVLGHDTPYLGMKLGKVAEVPYAPPGSPELFAAMEAAVGEERGYLLSHHGGIVGGLSLMNAFEAMEELEQAAWLCWQLREHRDIVSEKVVVHDPEEKRMPCGGQQKL